MTYVVFGLILMGLILVHELGHFAVAKWCGMRVERFSIFFGRPLARFTRGETEYRIGWLPLGGYVKITGMTREELLPDARLRTDETDADGTTPFPSPPDPELVRRSYFAQKPWKRIATIFAGPAVNIVLAIIAFAIAFWIGTPTFLPTDRVAQVETGSPAAASGIRPGDRLVSVNGVSRLDDPAAFQTEIRGNRDRPVTLTVIRGGETIKVAAVPRELPTDGASVTRIGVGFDVVEGPADKHGFVDGIGAATTFAWDLTEANFRAIGRAFTDEQARSEISSVVGIGAAYKQASEDGVLTVLRYIGYISLILGVFNLLPLLPLDGGHILFAFVEKLKGSAITRRTYERASLIGLATMLLLFFLIALPNDISRLSGEGFQTGR
jgi:regulator of sigma E protease